MSDLHPQLTRDCKRLGRFELCHLLLMLDANYPWFILVPDRDDIREIYQLSDEDQQTFLRESCLLAKTLMTLFKGDKLNIAALGNIVPQLHIHHIVRYTHDVAWPAPVWGKHPAQSYAAQALVSIIEKVTSALPENFIRDRGKEK